MYSNSHKIPFLIASSSCFWVWKNTPAKNARANKLIPMLTHNSILIFSNLTPLYPLHGLPNPITNICFCRFVFKTASETFTLFIIFFCLENIIAIRTFNYISHFFHLLLLNGIKYCHKYTNKAIMFALIAFTPYKISTSLNIIVDSLIVYLYALLQQ